MRFFKLDLKFNKKMMFYKGVESVDSLFLLKDGLIIYFCLGKVDESNFWIVVFDLKMKKYKNLYFVVNDQDDIVSSFFYNKKIDLFVLLYYFVEEDYKKIDEVNEKGIDFELIIIYFVVGY